MIREWLTENTRGAYTVVVITYLIVYSSSYVYTVIVARLLGPSDFSLLASLLAIGTIVAVGIGGPSQSIIARYVAADSARGLESQARYLVRKALIVVAVGGGVVVVTSLALSWPIKGWLNAATLPPVMLFAFYMGEYLVQPVIAGVVQGLQEFRVLSVAYISGAVARVLLGILLVSIGLRVTGAMMAELLSGIILLALLGVWVQRWLGAGKAEGPIDYSHLKRFAPTVVITSTCMIAFIYIDVFLVRGLIGGSQAGYYTAAQKLATVMYLIPGVFALVLFPKVSADHVQGVSSWSLFARVEAAVAALCGAIALFLIAFPGWTIRLVFGARYANGTTLVPILAVAMFFFSLLPVCVQFLLATDNYGFMYVLIAGLITETVSIVLFHPSTRAVAWIVAITAAGLAAVMGLYVLASRVRVHRTRAEEPARTSARRV
jgi:O-antigen/teichoic acid export membrane protein